MKKKNQLCVYSFYRFTELHDLNEKKKLLISFFESRQIRGSILIAEEGINASIAGAEKDLCNALKYIRGLLNIRKVDLKINVVSFLPFNKLKVRVKKEIVTLGRGKVNIVSSSKNYLEPLEWNEYVRDSDVKVLDVRNSFEINIGKFIGSKNPETVCFRQFPQKLERMKIDKNSKIAMYCTGGIRCEKVSAFLKKKGYKKIFQLKGGVLNYLKYVKDTKSQNLWKGECFVFDNRVSVNKDLLQGNYNQCHGCRMPITMDEMKSKYYQRGVSCHHCYDSRTNKQKERSLMRQKQIEARKEKLKL